MTALRRAATEAYLDQNYEVAFGLYQQILALDPKAHDIYAAAGEILLSAGRFGEASPFLEKAVIINPRNTIAWYNMALTLQHLNEWDSAQKAIEAAISLAPDMPKFYFTAGTIYRAQGRHMDAIETYKVGLRMDEKDAEAWSNLGLALYEINLFDDAITAYMNALKHNIRLISAHNNLSIVLLKIGKLEGARRAAERVLAIEPENHYALNVLGCIESQCGRHELGISFLRRAIAADDDFWKAHSNLLFCLLHKDNTTLAEIRAEHEEWYRRYGARHARPNIVFKNTTDPNRRLRIGFVSGDFRRHPVGYFTISTLEKLCAENSFDIYFYANQFEEDEDPFVARFKAMAGDHWRHIWEIKPQTVCEMIKKDEIDILFDLTGHNDRHRLDVFCARAAPVQVTWAGYMATTGVPQMDWLLGDSIQTPEKDQPYYTERLYQMPHSFIAYTPPSGGPAPARIPPSIKNGFITFASFNKPTKITARTIRIWSEIMQQLPDSRLLLKFLGFGDPEAIHFFCEQFTAHGIRPEQLTFEPNAPHHELLARYNDVDMALDPMPYTGSTTTLEALWMGTPLVTLPGDIFPARHAATYLTAIGATELIAADEKDYIDKIVALARDPKRLVHYKENLRQQMQQSPLCNQDLFVPSFKDAIHHFWRDYCSNRP